MNLYQKMVKPKAYHLYGGVKFHLRPYNSKRTSSRYVDNLCQDMTHSYATGASSIIIEENRTLVSIGIAQKSGFKVILDRDSKGPFGGMKHGVFFAVKFGEKLFVDKSLHRLIKTAYDYDYALRRVEASFTKFGWMCMDSQNHVGYLASHRKVRKFYNAKWVTE